MFWYCTFLTSMLCIFSPTSVIAEMKVTLPDTVTLGSVVKAKLTGVTGKVGIESDITNTSTEVNVTGDTEVSLGSVKQVGFFTVRFIKDNEKITKVVFVLPEADSSKATLQEVVSKPGYEPLNVEMMKKFIKNLTVEQMKKAAKTGLVAYLSSNAVGVGTTITVCIAAPYFPPAISPCVVGTVANSVDLASSILIEAVNLQLKENLLTMAEANTLRLCFKAGNFAVQLVAAGGSLPRLFVTAKAVLEATVEHQGTQLALKLSIDEANRVILLIKLFK